METALMSERRSSFHILSGALGRGGGLFRGELLFHAKTDGTFLATYVDRPMPRLFLEVKGTDFCRICYREVFTSISSYRV